MMRSRCLKIFVLKNKEKNSKLYISFQYLDEKILENLFYFTGSCEVKIKNENLNVVNFFK